MLLCYFAASAEDADGKEHHCVLNRNEMWECSVVEGSSTAYDFAGKENSVISMRSLPCPCTSCQTDNPTECSNVHIVSTFHNHRMTLNISVAPEYLQLPLAENNNYTVAILKAFLRQHGLRVPGGKRRAEYIQIIVDRLPTFLLPAADANALAVDNAAL